MRTVPSAVEEHITSISGRLVLRPSATEHRRVHAPGAARLEDSDERVCPRRRDASGGVRGPDELVVGRTAEVRGDPEVVVGVLEDEVVHRLVEVHEVVVRDR